ncbi:two-component sensor histidine kinase [Ramlibacter sp. AW1]|uniref:histidine kinase n=2 Tax=Ramlibacter aurantiacus TaxID=2801330 RepID=A0A936ZKW6_9BURK|nr:ATP-binding protein [Ramlibacter aurantiacus]MBL0419110.1 two-component sensor histidine kinase [Ramlibacter aurantiacus]
MLAAIAVTSALQAAGAWRTALRNADALFDAQLQVVAQSLEHVGTAPGGGLSGFAVRIFGPGGVLLFEAGPMRLPQRPVIGFSDVVQDGVHLRVYTLQTADRTVQVAQDLDARRARARAMAWSSALPVIGLGLLLMAAVWFVIDRSLAPVERMRRQVAAREADDLSPLPEDGLPQEVRPLLHDLNLLFARVREAIDARQQFLNQAAHELRSPLAALRLQVQALRRRAQGSELATQAQVLEAGVARAAALVSQLLALAREEALPPAGDAVVPLEPACREVIGDLLPLAQSRRIDLGLQPSPPLHVRGDAPSLQVLLRNLLDNAIKYTPEGGRVDIGWEDRGERTTITVEDSGPGIAAADRERLLAAFERGAGTADAPGSGLGLAIASAVVRRHGGAMSLGESSRLGGLRVTVSLPSAP